MIQRLFLAAMLCLLPHAASARCAPFEDSAQYFGMIVDYSLAAPEGPHLIWDCYAKVIGQVPWKTRHCIHAPWTAIDLRRLGDRGDTIRKAADPVAAWHASYKRHVQGASTRCQQLLETVK